MSVGPDWERIRRSWVVYAAGERARQRADEERMARRMEEHQAVWMGAYMSIFDAYERWRRPWWARVIAWGIAVIYALRRG